MSSSPSVEQLLAILQKEREKNRSIEIEQDHLKQVLNEEKGKQIQLQNAFFKISAQKDQAQKEMDKIKAGSVSVDEKNTEYVDQIEIALTDIQYGDMSLGDLNRLFTIYLNEMNRVKTMISKLTNNKQ